MRISSLAMALGSVSTLGFFLWASGCTSLSDDCELNLNCPAVYVEKPACNEQIFPGTCDACLQTSCCQEMADCISDANTNCLGYCVGSVLPSPPECTTVAGPLLDKFTAVTDCLKTKCAGECPPPDRCNPVTHNGCMGTGSACELIYPGVFTCFGADGMPAAACQPCDFVNPPFCGSGLRCHPVSKTCGKYCCNDMDCGTDGTGYCELDPMIAFGADVGRPDNMVGLCMLKGAMTPTPSCDATAVTMSGGSCFAGYPGM